MSACEQCWNDAYTASKILGGDQVEHYNRLLEERENDRDHARKYAEGDD